LNKKSISHKITHFQSLLTVFISIMFYV